MKNIMKYAIAAAMPLLFAQCQMLDEPVNGGKDEAKTVDLVLAAPQADTKTVLQDNSVVLWEEGDHLMINGDYYDVEVNPEDPAYATVKGVRAAEKYVAVYPDGGGYEWDDYMYVHVPEVQKYREGGFAQWTNPMIAVGSGTNLSFVNMGSVLRIGLTGVTGKESVYNVADMVIRSNSGTPMSGEMVFYREAFEYGDYTMGEFYGSDKVMMTFSEPLALGDEVEYLYVVVPPITCEEGFTVLLANDYGRICEIATSNSITFERAKIKQMEDVACSFSSAISIKATTVNPTSAELSVTTGASGMDLRYMVVEKASYDRVRANYSSVSDFQFNRELLNWNHYSTYLDGTSVQFGVEDAIVMGENIYDANYVSLSPETKYVVLAGYAVDGVPFGGVRTNTFTTTAPTGEAPVLEMKYLYSDWTSSTLNILTDVDRILVAGAPKAYYESMTAEGRTDNEIVAMGGYTDVWSVGQWAEYNFSGHFAETEYVFLAKAVSEGGIETFARCEYTTTSYAEDNVPEYGEWYTVTDKATFEFGLFRDVNGNLLTLRNIKVEESEDGMYYRIENLFSVKNNPVLADYGFIDTGETCYTYINKNDYWIHGKGNKLSVVMAGGLGSANSAYQPLFIGNYSTFRGEDWGYGWYDEYEGRITFQNLSLGDIFDNILDNGSESYLYLYEKGNDTMTTENFTKTEGEIEW